MKNITKDNTVKDVLINFPNSYILFMDNNLNLELNYDKSLEEVFVEKDLDVNMALQKINLLHEGYLKENEPFILEELNNQELIEYIVDNLNEYLYFNLPRINSLVKTIFRVHGKSHPELKEVFRTLSKIIMEVDESLILKETTIFQAIEKNNYTSTDEVLRFKKYNQIILEEFKKLRSITNNYEIPADVCGTFKKTYEMLKSLDYKVFVHFLLEEEVLFANRVKIK